VRPAAAATSDFMFYTPGYQLRRVSSYRQFATSISSADPPAGRTDGHAALRLRQATRATWEVWSGQGMTRPSGTALPPASRLAGVNERTKSAAAA